MRRSTSTPALALLSGVFGCGGFLVTTQPEETAAILRVEPVQYGAFQDLSPLGANPSPGVDPRLLIDQAISSATAASIGERMMYAPGDASADAALPDPFFVAWLQVDEALNLARIEAAQLPEPQPVSVERQQLARAERQIPPGELHLRVLNTDETYAVRLFDNDGRMRIEAVAQLTRALRDQRADAARSPEPRLLTMLYLIGQYYDAELQVVSAYRVRNLNASEGSRHGAAAACDIRIRGVGIRELARFAETTFANVGVGYYPNSDFVHLDVRSQSYYWIDYSGSNQRSRTRSRSVSVRASEESDVTLRSIHITEEELYQLPPERSGYGYE